jgi:hypothetical protein
MFDHSAAAVRYDLAAEENMAAEIAPAFRGDDRAEDTGLMPLAVRYDRFPCVVGMKPKDAAVAEIPIDTRLALTADVRD